jgi:transposase
MKSTTLWVGLDVHKESISVAVFERDRPGRPCVTIPNEPTQIRKLFSRLKKEGEVHACYEAGSCGYEVYRQLAAMGIACDVVAPGLIPVRVGDRVKTDRRDAEKLARLFRAGELTSIRVPTEVEEALRDLIRCREDAREDVLRQRHHVLKFLLRHGRVFRETKHWTLAHWVWLRAQRFDEPLAQFVFTEYMATLEKTLARITTLDQEIAKQGEKEPYKALVGRLRCLRGIDTLSAMALIAEICDFARFEHPRELMAYLGLVPSERSSGGKQRRGSITKTGNGHARRIFVEASWHYRHAPAHSKTMKARWEGQPQAVVDHAFKAQERLHRRYVRLTSRGKPSQVAIVAVARELCGFVWAVARTAA